MSVLPDSRSPIIRGKHDLGERLRQIRSELYGAEGIAELVGLLGIPSRSWSNYENGVTIPGEVLLLFLILTRVEPQWLLHGEGPRFAPFL